MCEEYNGLQKTVSQIDAHHKLVSVSSYIKRSAACAVIVTKAITLNCTFTTTRFTKNRKHWVAILVSQITRTGQ